MRAALMASLCGLLLIGAGETSRAQRVAPNGAAPSAEQRFRRGLGRIVKARLGLTDAQMAKLQETNRKYEPQRVRLLEREREVRVGLRAELVTDSSNQPRVGALIDQWLKVQRERLDLVEAEQRDLAQFLSPVQRAKYVVLQEELRRRAEKMRRARQEQRQGARRENRPPRTPPD
jgi:hypothetical protein